MARKFGKETLADKIAGVLNTTPASFDPEDAGIDETRAKLIENFTEENDNDEELLSTFRKQNVELLGDVDERYAGKKASRKKLYDSDEDVLKNANQSDLDDDSESLESEDDENHSTDNESVQSYEERSEDEDESQESEEDSSAEENFDDKTVLENNGNVIKHFKEIDGSSQIKKGLCVRNQMSMWESLLEMRIQLQKCLISANKMPQKDSYMEIKKQSRQEFSGQAAITKNCLVNLLDKLLLLQKLSLSKYPETKKLHKDSENRKVAENDDEEIPSDSDQEKSSEEEGEDDESVIPKKKRKLNDFEKVLNDRHSLYKNYRDSIIQKWNDKTKIAVLKNNANSHSVLNHIEHTLSDRTKLIKRTQLKRSEYTILGQKPTENELNESNDNTNENRFAEEYNTEIFDDDDFYHHLLRELIEVKSADLTDPVQLGRQWIQLQKLRSKMKRKIDTRATKGRKIRYTVHTKLVNFMAPIDENLWTDQAKTELFNSLFGKKEYVGT